MVNRIESSTKEISSYPFSERIVPRHTHIKKGKLTIKTTMAKRCLFLIALLPAIATSQAVEGDRWGVTASADAEVDRASDKKKDSASSVSVESPSTPSPTVTCHNIEIGLVFDEYPDETKWQITKGRRNSIEHDAAVVLKESPYYDPEEGYSEASETHIICLPPGKYTYTIMDRNRDGMCCDEGEGRYALTYQETGDIITHGSEFEQYESVTFNVPYVAPMLKDTDGDGVEDRTKNVIPPMILGSDGFPAETCENEFGLTLKTVRYCKTSTLDYWLMLESLGGRRVSFRCKTNQCWKTRRMIMGSRLLGS